MKEQNNDLQMRKKKLMKEQNITYFKLNSKENNVFVFLYNINIYINFR